MKYCRLAAGCIGLVGLGIAAIQLTAAPAEIEGSAILGARPNYGPTAVSHVPNEAAIVRRIWMPGLDEGYNAQGLTVVADGILVAAYQSESSQIHRGPCRVFQVYPAAGRTIGQFDVPPPCGHAGGLATGPNGGIYVADTHTLFVGELTGAFSGEARFRAIPLAAPVTGALAVSGQDAIWIGTYRTDGPGRLYRFGTETLDHLPDATVLSAADAATQIGIPSHAQGAAIDAAGRLWVARSGLRWGELDRLDVASGKVEREYRAPAGIEGIAFDGEGRLWAVSEAGARHYYEGSWGALVLPFYPLIFAIDPQRLE